MKFKLNNNLFKDNLFLPLYLFFSILMKFLYKKLKYY